MTIPTPRPAAFRLAEHDPVIRRAVNQWVRQVARKTEAKEQEKTNG